MAGGHGSQSQGNDLQTVRDILLGDELLTVRNAVSDIESTVASQLAGLKDEVSKAISQAKVDVSRECKTIGHTVFEEGKKRLEGVETLENKIGELEARLASTAADIERRIADLESQFEALKTQSTKVSGVLQNFAQIIAGTAASHAAAPDLLNVSAPAAAQAAPRPAAKPATPPAPAARPATPPRQTQSVPIQPRPAAAPPRQTQSIPIQPSPAKAPQQTQSDSPFAGGDQRDLPGSDDFLKNIDEIFKLDP